MQAGQDLLRSVALGSLLSPTVLHHGEMRFREEKQIYQLLRKVINNYHFACFERVSEKGVNFRAVIHGPGTEESKERRRSQ